MEKTYNDNYLSRFFTFFLYKSETNVIKYTVYNILITYMFHQIDMKTI